MPDINEDFLANPERFASLHALYPFTPVDVDASAIHGNKSAKVDRYGFVDVADENEVFYCDIRKSTATQENEVFPDSNRFETDARNQENYFVLWITAKPTASTSFPVYYLPWKRFGAVRMRLRAGTEEKASKKRPHIFITAALQGCGVYVDGIPRRPTVYHLNLGGRLDSGLEMNRLHSELESEFPIDHGKEGMVSRGTVPRDYMVEHDTPGLDNAQKYGWYNPAGWVYPRWNIGTAQRGTVFGRFHDGGWSFYRQTRTFIRYRTYNWFPSLGLPSWNRYSPVYRTETEVRQWVVNRCHQFWPSYRACSMR